MFRSKLAQYAAGPRRLALGDGNGTDTRYSLCEYSEPSRRRNVMRGEQSAAVVTTEQAIDVTCEQCKELMTPEIDSQGILGGRRS
jgi:hypothetical protein